MKKVHGIELKTDNVNEPKENLITDEQYNELCNHRNTYQEEYGSKYKELDKIILAFSTGSFALSITFIDKIGGGLDKSSCKVLIVIAWSFLLLSIIAHISSFIYSAYVDNKKVKEIDKSINNNDNSILTNNNSILRKEDNVTININFLCLGLFGAALLLILIYSSMNIYRKGDNNGKSKTTEATTKTCTINSKEKSKST